MSINYLARWNCGSLGMNQIHEHAALISILNVLYMLDNKVCTWSHPSHSKENVICKEVRCQSLHTTPEWESDFSLDRETRRQSGCRALTLQGAMQDRASEIPTNQNLLHLIHYKHSKKFETIQQMYNQISNDIFKVHHDTSHPSTKINKQTFRSAQINKLQQLEF